ncbi:hypothetical protein R3P38DRAFT_3172747 [Favolaschia claudopus]|uniref:Uncharacterized protein n=1 Tax=Favolaschia claudopus TaxID=2862362 RepID=A0AAW0DLH2_9AGAR
MSSNSPEFNSKQSFPGLTSRMFVYPIHSPAATTLLRPAVTRPHSPTPLRSPTCTTPHHSPPAPLRLPLASRCSNTVPSLSSPGSTSLLLPTPLHSPRPVHPLVVTCKLDNKQYDTLCAILSDVVSYGLTRRNFKPRMPELSTVAKERLRCYFQLLQCSETLGDGTYNEAIRNFVNRALPDFPIHARQLIIIELQTNRFQHRFMYCARKHSYKSFKKGTANAFEALLGSWGEEATQWEYQRWVEVNLEVPLRLLQKAIEKFYLELAKSPSLTMKRDRESSAADTGENRSVKRRRANRHLDEPAQGEDVSNLSYN